MPSTLFKPFNVYIKDPENQYAKALPFEYVLCLTSFKYLVPTSRANVFVIPLLPGRTYHVGDSLRLPIINDGANDLRLPSDYSMAIDLMQPLPEEMLVPHSQGEILESEKDELERFINAFLPFQERR
ncbi:MAG: hypothetical protein AAFZ52_06485 [Bacteroidota bacterium]